VTTPPILQLKNVTVCFDGLTAADNVSIDVSPEKITAIIGPNGAGKTTIFNAITGVCPPTSGQILLENRSLEDALTSRAVTEMVVKAILAATGAVLAFNCQSLWERAINERFIFGQPFAWGESLQAFLSTLSEASWTSTVLPFLLVFGVTLLGQFSVWSRARHSPVVASGRGISRTFQNIRAFGALSVRDNVLLGLHRSFRAGWLPLILRTPKARAEEKLHREQADALLHFVGLSEVADRPAGTLPYGLQRRLEIARALASNPRLVLLDEPAAGMNPSELSDLVSLIESVRDRGHTVVVIEHHMKLVMSLSDEIAVLVSGEVLAVGQPEAIRSDARVVAAYLGESV
jgi:ABC-type branched-subunit amino acid transport system ATPase component